jgi:hypothetical protein
MCREVMKTKQGTTGLCICRKWKRQAVETMYRYHDSSFSKAPAFLRLSRVMPLWSPQPSDGIERWARAPALLVTESISLWRRARCACSGAAYSKRPSPHEDHQLEIGTRKTAKTAVSRHMALRRRAESGIGIQGRHASSSAGRMGERGIDGSDRREELPELCTRRVRVVFQGFGICRDAHACTLVSPTCSTLHQGQNLGLHADCMRA